MGQRPRLLVLSNKLPYPPDSGDKIRLYNLLRYLAREWQIDLIAYAPAGVVNAEIDALRTLCSSVMTIPLPHAEASRWHKYRRLLLDPRPAAMALYTPAMADAVCSALAAPYNAILVSSLPMAQFVSTPAARARTVYDQVDVYYVNCLDAARRLRPRARPYFYAEALKLMRYERQLASGRFGRCTVVSAGDARAITALTAAARVDVVPNGVDTHFFQPMSPGKSHRLVFTGTMNYWPNIDAMTYFCRWVMPLLCAAIPDVHLDIVGHSPLPDVLALASEHVTVTGRVEDIRPYIAAASVYVAPFRAGTGTHLKILEAMSMGKAVVATSRGAQGLGAVAGTHLQIGDDPATLAAAIGGLLDDSARREGLGGAARAFAVSRHDWSQVARRMGELLAEVASPPVAALLAR